MISEVLRSLRLTYMRTLACMILVFCPLATPVTAATLTLTIAAGEPVIVTGTPRIAIDVGGVTRYASYTGSTGAPLTSLPFSYAVQAGDFDADGINVTPQIDRNGATLTDRAGNPPAPATFTKPDTSALKVQTYTTSFTSTSDVSAVSFTIAKAPTGASFSYSVSSSGGSATVTGSGTIGSLSHTVTGVDVSALPGGTLTLSVTVSNASGTGAAKTASFTPSFTGILDSLPTAAAAYSVRRLRAAYTGPLLRVRRATDNVQQDIGFTVGGNLDTAKLVTFCGSDTCHVTSWYDQSPNGWNATKTNTTQQPRIVDAGSLELLGSKPGVRFFGAQNLSSSSYPANANEFTISITAVERNRHTNSAWQMTGSTIVQSHMPWSNGIFYFDVGGNTGVNRIQAPWPLATNTPAVVSYRNSASAGTRNAYLNGTLLVSGTGFAAATGQMTIGNNYDGVFAEFVLFSSSLSTSIRQSLEQSQGSYYGVTVQ